MSLALQRLSEDVGVSERTLRRAVAQHAVRAERTSPKRLFISAEEMEYVRSHWEQLRQLRKMLRTEPNVAFACVFGSVARGSDRPDSDLDLLVALRRESPLALARLAQRIERQSGRRVQIVGMSDARRNPSLLLTILRDARVLVDRTDQWEALQKDLPRLRRQAERDSQALRQRAADATAYFTERVR